MDVSLLVDQEIESVIHGSPRMKTMKFTGARETMMHVILRGCGKESWKREQLGVIRSAREVTTVLFCDTTPGLCHNDAHLFY